MINDKRKIIMDAALSIFAKKGYAETKMQDIAVKSGLACGTIYNYFKNKEELFDSLERPDLKNVRPSYDIKKKEIIQKALVLFGGYGYKATTMDMIAESCGFSVAMLYQYFSSKKKLYIETLNFFDFAPDIKHILYGQKQDLKETIAAAGAYYLKTLSQPFLINISRMIISEPNRFSDIKKKSSKGIDMILAEFSDFLYLQQEKGLIKVENIEAVARSFIGMLAYHVFIEKLIKGSKEHIDEKKIAENAAEILLHGISK